MKNLKENLSFSRENEKIVSDKSFVSSFKEEVVENHYFLSVN